MNIEKLRSKVDQLLQGHNAAVTYEDVTELFQELESYRSRLETQNTELRQTQGEVDTLRQRYTDLYLLAPVGYLIIDEMGKILDLNFTAAQMLQHERCAAEGTGLARYLTAESRPMFYEMLNDFRISSAPLTVELGLEQHYPGHNLYVRVSAQGYCEGADLRARLTMTDITDRIAMEKHLRESEAKHRHIAENLPGVVFQFVLQPDGNTYFSHVTGNAEAADKLGFTAAQIMADPLVYYSAIVPEDFAVYAETLQQSAQTMTSYSLEFRLRRPTDGEVSWLNARATPKQLADGSIVWTGIAIDITERKTAEAALKQITEELEQRVAERTADLAVINKELEAFNYSVSHDLRAPLRTLDGFSQVLMEDYGDQLDKDGQQHLQRIRLASQNMTQLIDSLLNLSRISRQGFRQTEVDLSAICQEMVTEFHDSDPNRNAQFSIQPGVVVTGDRSLLYIALHNLLSNAWKFTSKNATTCIEFGVMTLPEQRIPVFFVRDNGVGFDMACADKLFAPFQRLHNRTEFEGTGIGLATVQRIIHRHGGRVWVESAVNAGTTLYFTLHETQKS